MRPSFTSPIVLGLLALAPVMGCRRDARDERPSAAPAIEETRRSSPPGAPLDAVSFQEGFAAVVLRVAPTVVNVSSLRVLRAPAAEQGPFSSDPLLRDLFGFGQGGRPQRELRQQSFGSGVLVSRKGLVLTNFHVVKGASEVRVALADKRELVAKIVGTDPKTDIALIQIPGEDFQFASFGDSNKVRIGQFALAFGDPLGVGQTVTAGIISATGRGNVGIVDYEDFIQTDAAINPGNSGGPLMNVDGELIGINTAIATSGGRGNQGIGFAVPSNLAREVMRQIEQHGHVIRGWLGVAVQDLTPAMAAALNLEETKGALVSDVQEGSPAASAGLVRGDVVMEVDGKAVTDSRALRMSIAEGAPGKKVKLGVMRNDKRLEVTATLGELPADDKQAKPAREAPSAEALGVQVAKLTPELKKRLDLPDRATGVVITGVAPGSRAAEVGLRPGDVVQEVDRGPVESAADLEKALAKDKGRSHLLLVWREGVTHFVAIPGKGGK